MQKKQTWFGHFWNQNTTTLLQTSLYQALSALLRRREELYDPLLETGRSRRLTRQAWLFAKGLVRRSLPATKWLLTICHTFLSQRKKKIEIALEKEMRLSLSSIILCFQTQHVQLLRQCLTQTALWSVFSPAKIAEFKQPKLSQFFIKIRSKSGCA